MKIICQKDNITVFRSVKNSHKQNNKWSAVKRKASNKVVLSCSDLHYKIDSDRLTFSVYIQYMTTALKLSLRYTDIKV